MFTKLISNIIKTIFINVSIYVFIYPFYYYILYIAMNLIVVKLQHCWGLSPSEISKAVPIPVRMLAVLSSIVNTGCFPQIFWMNPIASRRSSNTLYLTTSPLACSPMISVDITSLSRTVTTICFARTSNESISDVHTKSLVGAKIISLI